MDRVRELIKEIREYGINNEVPIMSEETIEVISNIIKENNPRIRTTNNGIIDVVMSSIVCSFWYCFVKSSLTL